MKFKQFESRIIPIKQAVQTLGNKHPEALENTDQLSQDMDALITEFYYSDVRFSLGELIGDVQQYNCNEEYRQACIVILRSIFKDKEIID